MNYNERDTPIGKEEAPIITTKQKVKDFFLFMGIQLTLYLLLVINYRAIAQGGYTATIITDFTIASFQFFVIKKIANSADALYQWAGYATGGAIGGGLGIWVSQTFFNT